MRILYKFWKLKFRSALERDEVLKIWEFETFGSVIFLSCSYERRGKRGAGFCILYFFYYKGWTFGMHNLRASQIEWKTEKKLKKKCRNYLIKEGTKLSLIFRGAVNWLILVCNVKEFWSWFQKLRPLQWGVFLNPFKKKRWVIKYHAILQVPGVWILKFWFNNSFRPLNCSKFDSFLIYA